MKFLHERIRRINVIMKVNCHCYGYSRVLNSLPICTSFNLLPDNMLATTITSEKINLICIPTRGWMRRQVASIVLPATLIIIMSFIGLCARQKGLQCFPKFAAQNSNAGKYSIPSRREGLILIQRYVFEFIILYFIQKVSNIGMVLKSFRSVSSSLAVKRS